MRLSDIKPKQVIWIAISLLLISYAIFQARFLLFGPKIYIDSHKDGETVLSSVITIEGRARNAAWLSFNDRQIFTDEEGFWSEKLILQEGLSIITVKVEDRFGREREKRLTLVLK